MGIYHDWLVVYLPLWKIWVHQLGWWHSQYVENKINVPNHQPAYYMCPWLNTLLFLGNICTQSSIHPTHPTWTGYRLGSWWRTNKKCHVQWVWFNLGYKTNQFRIHVLESIFGQFPPYILHLFFPQTNRSGDGSRPWSGATHEGNRPQVSAIPKKTTNNQHNEVFGEICNANMFPTVMAIYQLELLTKPHL